MGTLVQGKLIRFILQPLASISNRLSVKARDTVFVCSGLMIFLMHFVYNAEKWNYRFLYMYVFDCCMAGLMILSILPRSVNPVRFDKMLIIPWYGFALFALIAGITKSADYLPDAMLYLVMYPVFYIVWNNCDTHKIQRQLLRISRYSFFIFLFVNIVFFPISGRQYSGFFSNVNGVAYYLALVSCCFLIEILSCEKANPLFFLDLVLLGISVSLVFYSNSRTGQLALLMSFFLTVLLLAFTDRSGFIKVFVRRLVPIALSIVLFIPATLYVFQLPQEVSRIISELSVEHEQPAEPAPAEPTPAEPAPAEPTPAEPAPAESAPSAGEKLDSIREYNEQKVSTSGLTLDQISSGRITIWKEYCKHLGFWGHSNTADSFFIEGRGTYNSTAHMTILEFAYSFGILAGLLYLFFNILAGVKSIRYALRCPKNRYALMPFTITIAFGVMSLFAAFSTSFYDMIVFYYYLIQKPLMKKGCGADET